MTAADSLFKPDWPAPDRVKACVTTRDGGLSRDPYATMNLALHVGDDPEIVLENRRILAGMIGLPVDRMHWLDQVHGTEIVEASENAVGHRVPEADGAFTRCHNEVCVVMTADCLPILLCNQDGSQVSALHGGWRGLASGIIESGVSRFEGTGPLMAWLGPAIGPACFEVGDEVRDDFLSQNAHLGKAFRPGDVRGKWWADLYKVATVLLNAAGVSAVFGGGFCTFSESRFYSFRRDGRRSGRMASLIWINPD